MRTWVARAAADGRLEQGNGAGPGYLISNRVVCYAFPTDRDCARIGVCERMTGVTEHRYLKVRACRGHFSSQRCDVLGWSIRIFAARIDRD